MQAGLARLGLGTGYGAQITSGWMERVYTGESWSQWSRPGEGCGDLGEWIVAEVQQCVGHGK